MGTIRQAARGLAREGPDLFVCVGGDGLASYVADALLGDSHAALSLPLLGVAAGTANVGPIVSLGLEELRDLDPSALSLSKVGAVEARVGGRHLAYGFNDVVIGTTFLGRVEGEVRSLSAEAMARREEKLPEEPHAGIASRRFLVEKDGRPLKGAMARPAQIIAAPAA